MTRNRPHGISTVAAPVSWWNNDSFTAAAIQADQTYDKLKAQGKKATQRCSAKSSPRLYVMHTREGTHTTPGSPAKAQPPGDLKHVRRDVTKRSMTAKTSDV